MLLIDGTSRCEGEFCLLVDQLLDVTFFVLNCILFLLDVFHEFFLILSVVLFPHCILTLLDILLYLDYMIQNLSLLAPTAFIDWVRLHGQIWLIFRMSDQVLLKFAMLVPMQTV